MSLLFYGVCILGVVLGGLVLLVLYSLLVVAKKGDEYLDLMELEMLQAKRYASPFKQKAKSENLGMPTTSDLYHRGAH
jgi:hypothetical protein